MNQSEFNNSLLSDSSRKDLESELNSCKNEIKSLRLEIEVKNQKIHDYKREFAVFEQLEKDFKQDLELAQQSEERKWQKLKEELETRNNFLTDRVQYLDKSLFESEVEKTKLQNKLQDLAKQLPIFTNDQTDEEKNRLEIEKMKEKNNLLEMENIQLNNDFMYQKQQMTILEENHSEVVLELEKVNEILLCKKKEFAELEMRCNNLQEDFFYVKNELENFKCKPLNNNIQGNSLFAEVNDKRLEVQDKMAKMKDRYKLLRQKFNNQNMKIAQLRNANLQLCHQLEENNRSKNMDDHYIISNLESRIITLEKEIEMNRKQILENKNIEKLCESDVHKFHQNMMDSKNKEIDELKEQLNNNSRSNVITSKYLSDSNRDLRQYKALVAQLNCKVDELETEIKNYKAAEEPNIDFEENLSDNENQSNIPIIESRKSKKLLCDEIAEIDTISAVISDLRALKLHCNNDESDIPHNSLLDIYPKVKKTEKVTETKLTDNSKEKKVTFRDDTLDQSYKNPSKKGGKILERNTIFIPSNASKPKNT